MNSTTGEEKKKKSRPKLHLDDLATRLIQSNAGENYEEVCIKNVFDRIKFESQHIKRPAIPKADILESIPSRIAENLKAMGISQLLPTQRYTLPLLTDHDTDVFVGAATGNGKTLAFLIPIVCKLFSIIPTTNSTCRRPSALVIANTQVLQVQTFKVCKSLIIGTGLRASLVCGETDVNYNRRELDQGVDIIIATTGRLLGFLKEGTVSLNELKYFVYDEADKMTQQGAFRQEVAEISEFIPSEIKPALRSCFFTATLDAINGFENMFREDKFCTIRVPGNPLISHHIIPLDPEQESDMKKSFILMGLLKKDVEAQGRTLFDKTNKPYMHKTIVFVGLKKCCNFLAAFLRPYGYSVGVINSDLSLKMRNDIIQRFSDGDIHALISTDSMARGHDIPNVTHVINYDMDYNALDTFKHRAGRTARIGHRGTCTTLLSKSQFLLFDDPRISDMDPRRKRAAEFAHYLVVECGQRIPKCLVPATWIALKNELVKWEIPYEPVDVLKAQGYMMEEEKPKSSRSTRKSTRAVTPKSAASPSPSIQSIESKEKRVIEEKKERVVALPTPKLVTGLDDDGWPVVDASETERELTDDEGDDDCGGITIDDDDLYDDQGFLREDEWGTDSDPDAPNADCYEIESQSSNETVVDDSGPTAPLRWTDDEDEEIDMKTQEGGMDALEASYKREEMEEEEEGEKVLLIDDMAEEVEEKRENNEDEDILDDVDEVD